MRVWRGEMFLMFEGFRRFIFLGGRVRGGIGNCRWVRRVIFIFIELVMGSELELNV